MLRPPPRSPLFPYPTLSRPAARPLGPRRRAATRPAAAPAPRPASRASPAPAGGSRSRLPEVARQPSVAQEPTDVLRDAEDRKSTRLNSSHLVISYAVFCLKK